MRHHTGSRKGSWIIGWLNKLTSSYWRQIVVPSGLEKREEVGEIFEVQREVGDRAPAQEDTRESSILVRYSCRGTQAHKKVHFRSQEEMGCLGVIASRRTVRGRRQSHCHQETRRSTGSQRRPQWVWEHRVHWSRWDYAWRFE